MKRSSLVNSLYRNCPPSVKTSKMDRLIQWKNIFIQTIQLFDDRFDLRCHFEKSKSLLAKNSRQI